MVKLTYQVESEAMLSLWKTKPHLELVTAKMNQVCVNSFFSETFLITWWWQPHQIFLGQDKVEVLMMGLSPLREALTCYEMFAFG